MKKLFALVLASLMLLALIPVKPTMAGGAYNWAIIYNGQTIATGNAPTKTAVKNNAQAYFNSKLDKEYVVTYKYDAGWFYYLYVDKKAEPLWTGTVSVEDGIGLDVPEGKKDKVSQTITDWIAKQDFDKRVYTVSDAKVDNAKHTITVEVKKLNDWWSWSIVCPNNSTGDSGYVKGYDVAYADATKAASSYKGAKIADIKVFDDQKYIKVKLTTDNGVDGTWKLNLYINDELKYNCTAQYDACLTYANDKMREYSMANNAVVKLREVQCDYKNALINIYYASLKDPIGEVNFFFNDKLTGFVFDGKDFLDTYKFNFDDKVRLGDILEEIDYMIEHGVYIDGVKMDKYSYLYENWRLKVYFEKYVKKVPAETQFWVSLTAEDKRYDFGSMSAEELNKFVADINAVSGYKLYVDGLTFPSDYTTHYTNTVIYEVVFRYEFDRTEAAWDVKQNHDWRIANGFDVAKIVLDKALEGSNFKPIN